MSASASLIDQLSSVRCFAQALTGSQQAGDTYVAATLESLIEQPSAIDESPDPRSAVLSALIAIWLPIACTFPNADLDLPDAPEPAPPRARVAYLLYTTAELDVVSVASVMGINPREAAGLIDLAAHDHALQPAAAPAGDATFDLIPPNYLLH